MSSYIYKSAIELAKLIKSGKASSEEIVIQHLEQIKKHNSKLNAIVILLEEEAMMEAIKCDQEAKNGKIRGPLHGVPITIKEQFWLKGSKSTINSKRFKNWVAPEDAVIVSRLKEAGAIILGKSNAAKDLLDFQTNGDIYPECKNPFHLDHTPGGSSGGAAAALASGMVAAELGGDFGGSVRIPSNFCGLFGLKPTENTLPAHGNIPKHKKERSFIFHMATAGPMARTAHDVELLWSIMKGSHKSDLTTPRIDWNDPGEKELKDFNIGWVDEWPEFETGKSCKKSMRSFIEKLAKNGVETNNSPPPTELHSRSINLYKRLSLQLLMQEMPSLVKPLMVAYLKKGLLRGTKGVPWKMRDSFLDYSDVMGQRASISKDWESYFEKIDLLICPVGFGPAFRRCKTGTPIKYEGKTLPYLYYTWPFTSCFNLSGHPAMTIPLGLDENSLPLGVQVVGAYWSEPDLLHFAKLVSSFTPGFIKPMGY